MYRLMIKTHNQTGLKYLCITKRDDYINYPGSGTRWRHHLNKHGYDFSTEVLYEHKNYIHFLEKLPFVDFLLNVAESSEYANIIPEQGYEGLDGCNVVQFWEYAPEEIKEEIIKRRNDTIKENHWTKGENCDEISSIISEKQKIHWSNLTLDEKNELLKPARKGFKEFLSDKNSKRYREWKQKLSESKRKYFKNVDPSIISEKNRQARLNLSEEKKLERKRKIQEVYKTGKHDHLFKRYSEERQGTNNPNSKEILWYGEIYTMTEFVKNFGKPDKKSNVKLFNSRKDCEKLYSESKKEYNILICPHCGKQSEKDKNPAAFKRWHMDNCREKS